RLVTERFLNFSHRPPPLNEPRSERVSEVVEPEAFDAGTGHSGLPGTAEAVPVPAAEYMALCCWCPAPRQHGVGVRAEWHVAPAAALRDFQPNHAASTIYPVPRESQRLALPHAREERELDKISQGKVAALTAGVQ